MLRRIGTCRKKVMGLLRLMGNKADVVKGLAKRCNENWQVAPTSDIVRRFFPLMLSAVLMQTLGLVLVGYSRPSYHHDAESESLRKDSVAFAFQLPGPNINRDDRR